MPSSGGWFVLSLSRGNSRRTSAVFFTNQVMCCTKQCFQQRAVFYTNKKYFPAKSSISHYQVVFCSKEMGCRLASSGEKKLKKWGNASNRAKAICPPPPNHSIAGLFTLHISDVFVLPPRMHSIVLHVSIVKYRSPELVKRCNCFLFLQTTFLPQACPISYQLNLSNDIHLLMKFWDQPIKQYPKCTYSSKKMGLPIQQMHTY